MANKKNTNTVKANTPVNALQEALNKNARFIPASILKNEALIASFLIHNQGGNVFATLAKNLNSEGEMPKEFNSAVAEMMGDYKVPQKFKGAISSFKNKIKDARKEHSNPKALKKAINKKLGLKAPTPAELEILNLTVALATVKKVEKSTGVSTPKEAEAVASKKMMELQSFIKKEEAAASKMKAAAIAAKEAAASKKTKEAEASKALMEAAVAALLKLC